MNKIRIFLLKSIFRKPYLIVDSIFTYIKDIYWLFFSRKPYYNDVECCDRLYCSHCGGKLFYK